MPDSAAILQEAYDRARREYGGAIGQQRDELITPALVLDIDAAQRNIDRMAGELQQMGKATIRPHYKTHKSPDLARRQLQAGAGGLSMATVWEAAVLAAAGMDDLFVVNTVAHPAKLRALAGLARDHRILVAVDEAANAAAHSAAAVAAGSTLGIMVEVDTGMDRCGVDTAQEPGARPAGDGASRAEFRGDHRLRRALPLTPDSELRHARQREAMAFFTGVADLLEANGIPCKIRSAAGYPPGGGRPTTRELPRFRPGSYVVMDNFHGQDGARLRALADHPGVGDQPPERQVIVDAGNKSVAAPEEVTIAGHDHRSSASTRSMAFSPRRGLVAAGR